MVNIRKRGKVYQYQFEIAKVDGKRKYISKSGFKTKNEARGVAVKCKPSESYLRAMNGRDELSTAQTSPKQWMKI